MLRAVLDISNKELYGYMSNITGTIRQKELVADLSIMQHSHNKRNRGRQAKTYINQLLQNTGCNYEELSNVMTLKKQ